MWVWAREGGGGRDREIRAIYNMPYRLSWERLEHPCKSSSIHSFSIMHKKLLYFFYTAPCSHLRSMVTQSDLYLKKHNIGFHYGEKKET